MSVVNMCGEEAATQPVRQRGTETCGTLCSEQRLLMSERRVRHHMSAKEFAVILNSQRCWKAAPKTTTNKSLGPETTPSKTNLTR